MSGRSGGEERVLHSKLDIPARLASHSAALARLFYPILFGLALHGGRFRIFDLHPLARTSRAIGRAEPFRYNALAAELTRRPVHSSAVLIEMLIKNDAYVRAFE